MSTTLLKKETLERKWYVIDAAGKPLGRTAVIAANILRGKHKVDFTPNVDCGDFVIVINTDKAVLTGKKLDQKSYYRVSGWIGGLKDQGSRHDGQALRQRYGAGHQGHAPQEHPGQARYGPPVPVQGC